MGMGKNKKNPVPVTFTVSPDVLKKFDDKLRGRPRATVFKKFMEKVNNNDMLIDDLF